MKKYFITFLALFFLLTTQSFSEERKKGVLEKFKSATCEGFFFGIKAGKDCEKYREDATKAAKKNSDIITNENLKKNIFI